MLDFKIDVSKCTRCKECVRDCPSRVISIPDDGVPELKPEAEANCIRCQHCMAVCPTAALSILAKQPEDSISLESAALPSLDAMELMIKARRTTRRYKPEDVDPALIARLLDATAYAPTGANRRGLTFSVIDNRGRMKEIRQINLEALQVESEAGTIPEHFAYINAAVPAFFKYKSDLIFRGAPHMFIVSAGPDTLCDEDVTIALSTFEMLAASAGLGTTWCGMFKMALECVPAQKSLFGIAEGQNYYAMLFGLPKVKYARTVQRETPQAQL